MQAAAFAHVRAAPVCRDYTVNGDFLLARVGGDGELVDLTEYDIRLWMFWLGLHDILKC